MTYLEIKQGMNKIVIQPLVMWRRRKQFKDKTPTIISVNCIGGDYTMISDGSFYHPQ